jgi:tyrosine-specific transport protein
MQNVCHAAPGGSIAQASSSPVWLAAAGFTLTFGGVCYFSSNTVLDLINSALLGLVIASFVFLLVVAAPGVEASNLLRADWSAVPDTLPVVALAFVYQNIVPVIVSNLEGDATKVRTAIWLGLAIPLVMFTGWEAAMLGSLQPGATNAQLLPTGDCTNV